jgi:RNA polymerase sigma-70 factor (ECF subfamily)
MSGSSLDALEERYDRVLREHGSALRRAAAAYERDNTRREDLFQEICLAVWKALPHFRGEASVRTFVFRIAHNRGLTHRARRGPALGDLDEAAHVADPRPGPESEAAARERRNRLHGAVLSLPLPARQVLTLALEGLSQKEIGEVLGISENLVAVRLSRARASLRGILAERDAGGAAGPGRSAATSGEIDERPAGQESAR